MNVQNLNICLPFSHNFCRHILRYVHHIYIIFHNAPITNDSPSLISLLALAAAVLGGGPAPSIATTALRLRLAQSVSHARGRRASHEILQRRNEACRLIVFGALAKLLLILVLLSPRAHCALGGISRHIISGRARFEPRSARGR